MLIPDTYKEKVKLHKPTTEYWDSFFAKDVAPMIVIQDGGGHVSIEQGVLKVEDALFELTGKTCVEVVKYLQDQGLEAVLTNSKIALVPAILLQSFSNDQVIQVDLDRVPKNLSNEVSTLANNIYNIESVEFELVDAFDENGQIPLDRFTLVNNNLYLSDLGSYGNVRCMIKLHCSEFSFNATTSNLINAYTLLFTLANTSKQTENLFKQVILDSNNNING